MNDSAPGPGAAAYEMDRPRPSGGWWTRARLAWTACGVGALAALVAADRYLLRGMPDVAASADTVATVQRGRFAVTVQGAGALEPVDARVVAAGASGVVGEVLAEPGTAVAPGDPILRLVSGPLRQQARQAEVALAEAEASHRVLLAQFEDRKLAAEASVAQAAAAAAEARLRLDAEGRLRQQGAISGVDYERTRIRAEQTGNALGIEQRRRDQLANTIAAERAASAARLANRRLAFEQAEAAVAALLVVAGSAGTVQAVQVAAGEFVAEGAVVAKVADAALLHAVVRIPETFASQLAVGQAATVRALNTDVPAVVARVDPAVTDGSVVAVLGLDAAPPAGVRPDVSVRATIQVADVADTLFVRRPAGAYGNRASDVFVVDSSGSAATRRRVQFGVGTLRELQVFGGLAEGDRILVVGNERFQGADTVRLE